MRKECRICPKLIGGMAVVSATALLMPISAMAEGFEWPAVYADVADYYYNEVLAEVEGFKEVSFYTTDMNGDGTPELIIRMPGSNFDFYTMIDGEAQKFFTISGGFQNSESVDGNDDWCTYNWSYNTLDRRMCIESSFENDGVDGRSEEFWQFEQNLLDAEMVHVQYHLSSMEDDVQGYWRDYDDKVISLDEEEKWVCYVGGENQISNGYENEYDEFCLEMQARQSDAYHDAYMDEMSNVGNIISDYWASINSKSSLPFSEEDMREFGELVESGVEAINEYDPNILEYAAWDIGVDYGGGSFVGTYLMHNAASWALGDSESAAMLRKGLAAGAMGVINMMASFPSEPEAYSDCLDPITVNKDRAVVATYGTIDSILAGYWEQTENMTIPLVYRRDSIDPYYGEEFEKYASDLGRKDALDVMIQNYSGVYQQLERDYAQIFDVNPDMEDDMEQFRGSKLCCIIDTEGNILTAFLVRGDFEAHLDDNGNCSLRSLGWGGFANQDGFTTIDRDGNIIAQSTEQKDEWGGDLNNAEGDVVYQPISACGSMFRQSFKNDFDHGDYEVVELVDASGNVLYSQEGRGFSFDIIDDNFQKIEWKEVGSNDRASSYILMSTGEVFDKKGYEEYLENNKQEIIYSEDVNSDNTKQVTEQYYLNCEDNHLYDINGTDVADLSGGMGVADIERGKDGFLIVTKSKYYYVLDDNFERRFEPMQIPTDKDYELCRYGCFINRADDGMDLYDENGELALTFDGMRCHDRENKWGSTDWGLFDFICGYHGIGWYNLNTKELMLLDSIPENTKIIKLHYE